MKVTIKSKSHLTVPLQIQRRAGIKTGDRVEFRISGGIINIVTSLPWADDEYTPAQRRAIDARLARAAKGPYHGPFENSDDAIDFLRKQIRSRRSAERKTAWR